MYVAQFVHKLIVYLIIRYNYGHCRHLKPLLCFAYKTYRQNIIRVLNPTYIGKT